MRRIRWMVSAPLLQQALLYGLLMLFFILSHSSLTFFYFPLLFGFFFIFDFYEPRKISLCNEMSRKNNLNFNCAPSAQQCWKMLKCCKLCKYVTHSLSLGNHALTLALSLSLSLSLWRAVLVQMINKWRKRNEMRTKRAIRIYCIFISCRCERRFVHFAFNFRCPANSKKCKKVN